MHCQKSKALVADPSKDFTMTIPPTSVLNLTTVDVEEMTIRFEKSDAGSNH